MKNNSILKALCVAVAVAMLIGCVKKDELYKKFLDGHELVYPGVINHPGFYTGNLRAELFWNPSTDPSIARYIIYWNNKADSMVVKAESNRSTDTVKVVIPELKEYVYSFTVYSEDDKGNRSVSLDVSNVKVYGPVYQARLLNRAYNADQPFVFNADGSVKLSFNQPDTINTGTIIRYTNTADKVVEKTLRPDSSSITLKDYKPGSSVSYQSSYVPVHGAIDTFKAPKFSDFPQIYRIVPCDKSLFREHPLPNDIGTNFGTTVSQIWDGTVGPQAFPNLYHSADMPLPAHFTFDLGKVYNNLTQIEETGRNCCYNPDVFEVWGIADITHAETTLPGNSPDWPAEARAKGWTLLKTVTRTDDGQSAYKTGLDANPPPVRYIRIRVVHCDGSDHSFTISEVTLWNKE